MFNRDLNEKFKCTGFCQALIFTFILSFAVGTAHAIPSRMTPLKKAAFEGDLQAVRNLILTGISPDGELDHGITPMHLAALYGHIDVVACLIENGADVNICRRDAHYYHGPTPLHAAASAGNAEIVKLLLKHGAEIDLSPPEFRSRSISGGTALLAASGGDIETVEILLDNGADVKAEGLLHVVRKVEVAKLLIENGVPLNVDNSKGRSCLYNACILKNMDIARLFVAEGAVVGSLHEAVFLDDIELIKKMISKGADVNSFNEWYCPLYFARSVQAAKILITAGADVNAISPGSFGNMPLHSACRRGNLGVVKVLVENGADVNTASLREGTPASVAVFKGHANVLKYLIDNGADIQTDEGKLIYSAAFGSHKEIVLCLIDSGVDLNDRGTCHYTCLEGAVYSGDVEIMGLLLDRGAKMEDGGGKLLCAAAGRDKLEMVKYLIERGANVNAKLDNGWAALHAAVERNNPEIVKLLLDNGADIHATFEKGKSPLQIAEEKDQKDILELFKISTKGEN